MELEFELYLEIKREKIIKNKMGDLIKIAHTKSN